MNSMIITKCLVFDAIPIINSIDECLYTRIVKFNLKKYKMILPCALHIICICPVLHIEYYLHNKEYTGHQHSIRTIKLCELKRN